MPLPHASIEQDCCLGGLKFVLCVQNSRSCGVGKRWWYVEFLPIFLETNSWAQTCNLWFWMEGTCNRTNAHPLKLKAWKKKLTIKK